MSDMQKKYQELLKGGVFDNKDKTNRFTKKQEKTNNLIDNNLKIVFNKKTIKTKD